MRLLHGEAGIQAARAILAQTQIPVLLTDPLAEYGCPTRLLLIADTERAVVLDAQATASVGALLCDERPFAAYDAKRVHRALLATWGAGPRRWACIRLAEQLLLGGRNGSLDASSIAARHGLAPPPEPRAGLAELAAFGRAVAHVLAQQTRKLQADGLTWVSRIEAAAVAPIAAMEHHGMPLEATCWRALHEEALRERDALREQIAALVPTAPSTDLFGEAELSLDNDHSLRLLLSQAGFAVPDVRRATLAKLPPPWGPLLARYRELGKLVSAYGEGFLSHLGADGRVHARFEQIGASTGRLACHSPNLQSIVKDTPHRTCFRAPAGRTLVIADYATCELRILAEMSGDPVFAEAFARGDDLHARVASRVFGKPVSKTHNPELRERAKAVSFGLVYGMGAAGLARTIGASLAQAEALLHRYFESFPKIRGFLEHAAREALRRGYAQTLTGRRLYLEAGASKSSRAQAERVAKNMPIQGTSADITKIALARLHAALPRGAFLVNTVHDEIVVECDAADAPAVGEVVRREMLAAGAEVLHRTPLEVDVVQSPSWRK